jgi:hypothetical protein
MNARKIAILSEMAKIGKELDELILHYTEDKDDAIDVLENKLEDLEDELDMIDYEEDRNTLN